MLDGNLCVFSLVILFFAIVCGTLYEWAYWSQKERRIKRERRDEIERGDDVGREWWRD